MLIEVKRNQDGWRIKTPQQEWQVGREEAVKDILDKLFGRKEKHKGKQREAGKSL